MDRCRRPPLRGRRPASGRASASPAAPPRMGGTVIYLFAGQIRSRLTAGTGDAGAVAPLGARATGCPCRGARSGGVAQPRHKDSEAGRRVGHRHPPKRERLRRRASPAQLCKLGLPHGANLRWPAAVYALDTDRSVPGDSHGSVCPTPSRLPHFLAAAATVASLGAASAECRLGSSCLGRASDRAGRRLEWTADPTAQGRRQEARGAMHRRASGQTKDGNLRPRGFTRQ
jgi:hypothetical protein